LAPEILENIGYTEVVDTYAFGVICWELLSREMFLGEIAWLSVLQQKIVAGVRPSVPPCPESYHKIITLCWQPDSTKRPKMYKVVPEIEKMIKNVQVFKEKCQDTPKKSNSTEVLHLEEKIFEERSEDKSPTKTTPRKDKSKIIKKITSSRKQTPTKPPSERKKPKSPTEKKKRTPLSLKKKIKGKIPKTPPHPLTDSKRKNPTFRNNKNKNNSFLKKVQNLMRFLDLKRLNLDENQKV